MCGIVGICVSPGHEIDLERLRKMTDAISHRGPDASGLWLSPDLRVGLGHRRLSILDLSPAGAQPMTSPSGRFVVTYNGEIYNFQALRQKLEEFGIHFNGHSDTEIVLAAFERWGIPDTLAKLSGMFALAVWDTEDQSLWLARDRVGIKPFFYSTANNQLLFASELKPLVIYLGTLPSISQVGLSEYLRLGYVPGELSIFEGIHKLPPGCYAKYQNGQLSAPIAYWHIEDVVARGASAMLTDTQDAIDQLEKTLSHAVASHMVSDVPLGAFLSGGIDSSTVVALMQAQSSRPIKTFSIGFHERGYNEAEHAHAVAKHLGTEHTELYVSDEDARGVIPLLPEMYDEPFADPSQIPTFLVSRLARQHVTVALSGDGGDELFAGYNRYMFVSSFWRRLKQLPAPLRKAMAQLLASKSADNWDNLFHRLKGILPKGVIPALPGQKIHKVATILPAASLDAVHARLIAQWPNPELLLQTPWRMDMPPEMNLSRLSDQALTDAEQQMLWDIQSYLVDDILTKVDRASMRVSLEARVPLLDPSVIDLAWRIPFSMKLREGNSKWILRQVLYRYVPKALVERPKMGFSVPVDDWLRHSLHDWADNYLAADRLNAEGYLESKTVRQTWQQHRTGTINAGGQIWTLLMFQTWLENAKQWV
ncbi:asparagine synthase (glutamine-hydrolyzing) [Paludibacterium purpuratum]|uniref:asparagine synthase (glutamine-hydrolyzing) n=1 Tax=Paludibacterium purpuratum TaxID=1144873 RepID=A0A4R7B3Z8_9NEIS|nr:asparagine synthase (glutamine-hydrolyzing) [Paludibacterium purpuratum]TDR76715.1 asparagine synthase (glutamine-hydrolysing) [Paludibacterium purpuratum]